MLCRGANGSIICFARNAFWEECNILLYLGPNSPRSSPSRAPALLDQPQTILVSNVLQQSPSTAPSSSAPPYTKDIWRPILLDRTQKQSRVKSSHLTPDPVFLQPKPPRPLPPHLVHSEPNVPLSHEIPNPCKAQCSSNPYKDQSSYFQRKTKSFKTQSSYFSQKTKSL